MEGKVVDLSDKKVEIKYPVQWPYKIIINSHCKIHHIVENVIGKREYKVQKGNNSKNKTYESFKVTILVHSDDDRVALYEEFKKEDCVKIVL
jgi:putative lipoic acid-binding regulatory protein